MSTTANLLESDSPLFSTTPVVQRSTSPVIAIGLPRSGSTFLAHVLSCMKGLYVFDDLYPYQQAKALGLAGELNLKQQQAFLDKLSWSARIKVRFKKKIYAFAPKCTWEDIAALEEAVLKTFEGHSVTWPILLEEWLTRLAFHHQDTRWGYKTPQDFMNLDKLSELFPGAQFVFLMRDPRKVMASFKNLPRKRIPGTAPDGVSGQYHPLVYANYWQLAYQKTVAFMRRNPEASVYIIKFEDLVARPDEEAQKLADFLNTELSHSVQVERTNTSFKDKQRQDITNTEVWLCEMIAGKTMQEVGYDLKSPKPRIQDVLDLFDTTGNFVFHQTQRVFRNDRARQSVIGYLKNLWPLSNRLPDKSS